MLPSPHHHPPLVPLTGTSPPPIDGGRRGGLGSWRGCRLRVGARGHAGELGHCLPGHGQKRMQRKALRAVRKRNSRNEGKFVPISYQNAKELRTNSYEIRANFTFS